MDDLSGLTWSAPKAASASSSSTSPAPAPAFAANPAGSFYPALRPTPSPLNSGRNTPLSTQGSGAAAFKAPAASTPAQDSFSNLVNFGSAKSAANLSLREQQGRLEAEKRRKDEERRRQAQSHFGDGHFFDTLGQRPSPRIASPALTSAVSNDSDAQTKRPTESDVDLFAAFSANTKVDNSSHYPPPAAPSRPPATDARLDLSNPQAWGKSTHGSGGAFHNAADDDDDDPFGLSAFKTKPSGPPAPALNDDDDDLLGDLGKPVDQVKRPPPQPTFSREPEPGKAIEDSSSDSEPEQVVASDDPFDRAVAQLVDYGFTPENARRGLTESGGGLNVQAAVNWLLDDAHRQAKEKAKGGKGPREQQLSPDDERSAGRSRGDGPSWAREEGRQQRARDANNRSPALADGDFTKTAAAVGSNFLKTANSLWKTGQKKVQQAVSEFQQEGDASQPKWMRSAQQAQTSDAARQRPADVTDEALMLESGMRPGPRPRTEEHAHSNVPSRNHSPGLSAPRPGPAPSAPKWQQPRQPSPILDPRTRLNKQAAQEESFQAYVSPVRRKKATPQPPPEARPPADTEPDLLFDSARPIQSQPALPTRPPQPSPSPALRQTARPSPAPTPKPAPPPRQIPNVSAIALQSSTKHRLEGTAHFKRGDYAAAHTSYTSSLGSIPPTHPLAILLLCNRALTALKTGEPRQAVADADTAIQIIGPGKGEGEHVDLQGDGGKREMRELYGKALTRKAEALEQMEKWAEAEKVWQLCVESGLGGPAAIAGRQRCQKATAPKPVPKPAAARPAASRPPPARPAAVSQKSSEALARLRAVNQAAEQEGIEKIALVDKVDGQIAAWRDGKRENLRALLTSLDTVLWEGSGWKKVGLHELLQPNKVKIIYMKAIAKTHPDKVSAFPIYTKNSLADVPAS